MTLDCTKVSLKQGAKGSQVTELQTILKILGYYTAAIDGSYGPVTVAAVKKFQTKTGHTADGWFGPKTCSSLNQKESAVENIIQFDCPNTSLRRGSKGDAVTKLQTMLKELGYYTRQVDGDFGQYTEAAVKAYQTAAGHTADGWFGPKTCGTLNTTYKAKKVAETNATKTSTTTATTTPKVDRTLIDPTKEQYLPEGVGNFSIAGVRMISETITDTTSFTEGTWNTVNLLDNKILTYRDHVQPKEYDVVFHLSSKEFLQMRPTFKKFLAVPRQVVAVARSFLSGEYVISSIKREDAKWHSYKLTFHFIEVMK
ncbi:MAG: hypothetical protein BZ138_06000 [Methanosphaera sp. rholeuAM270]|nr:MAG: hypothetical protein BZ138_06000 [Methanosphaera sp. rholeuAM270]